MNSSENFCRSDIFDGINYWKERVMMKKIILNYIFSYKLYIKNDDIKMENEYFNTLCIGLNVMINNYNVIVILTSLNYLS